MMNFLKIKIIGILAVIPVLAFGQLYKTESAIAYFKSDAPLEIIEAKSSKLSGAINSDKGLFAFSIPIKSFEGFNNPLQREHFNENYLESSLYPTATFTGKIIEQIDFDTDGEYKVRAKGKLSVHGVAQERIIKSTIEIKKGKLYVNTNFSILLDDHKIRVPKIVYQKIAREIFVQIRAEFKSKPL